MNAREDIAKRLAALNGRIAASVKRGAHGDYEEIAREANALRDPIHEEALRAARPLVPVLIEKVEKRQALTDGDAALIEIVAGASLAGSYARAENNLKDWLAELERLSGELAALGKDSLAAMDAVTLSSITGTLEDIRGTSMDLARIENALDQHERFRRFVADLKLPTGGEASREAVLGILRKGV